MTGHEEMGRLDALRHLLAQHTPVEDDARVGHRYVYPKADRRIEIGFRERMQLRLERIRRWHE